MTYTIITFDDTKIPFDAKYLEFVEEQMKTGHVFQLGTELIRGSDIRRIQKGADTGEYGPHTVTHNPIPALEQGINSPQYAEFFWKKVLDVNRRREHEGKPHLYPSVVKWASAQCGHKNIDELEAFIDAEWETATEHNVPTRLVDLEVVPMTKAYFSTEEGRAYAMKWLAFDREYSRNHPS